MYLYVADDDLDQAVSDLVQYVSACTRTSESGNYVRYVRVHSADERNTLRLSRLLRVC